MRHVYVRIALFAAALASLFFFPWWVAVFLAFTSLTIFFAWEVLLIGYLIDVFYIPTGVSFFPLPATLLTAALLFALIPIRRRLSFKT